ncbi:MAG: GNAT family N-acetyltransferase [Dokdonella sp.]|uniref:GNAT family N-acetyltransferase n=1 Tax=Dokdonella sp. TaxID=2291710 RepID=UPI002C56F659|nr:GNAT family N-acetyltransferase [Dokdonella sp.]HOX72049.1 GNAT family N-acetyltransferase [Dokdonella sp.]HPG94022.1 GNAT family N-acetyltransferase [Dokdonella sp.]HPN78421.1 GNAT family N-acetyltransferase [Dokdonella sp.]
MTIAIDHQPDRQRFVALVEGYEGVLEYRLSGNTMTITHTGVPTSLAGRGIAGDLTRFALDTAKKQGWKIVPACSYAEGFFKKHPEYADLLA